jgi:uncharacterized cupin superfamily protein
VRGGLFARFPPGPRPHHFIAEGDEPQVLLEGGERRPEDEGCYVDLPKWWRGRQFLEAERPVPPETGDVSQVVHLDDVPAHDFQHDVDAGAGRSMRRLDRRTGLTRQAVVWSQVLPSRRSTAFHTHDRTDEWVLILSGRARVRVGDERFEAGPNDFIGHPAGGAAHVMEPLEPLTYLMGGMIDADDVVLYPEAGVRRVRGRLEQLG